MSADLPAVGAGEGLVAQRTGLDVRGEILVQLATVGTHALVTLHVRTSFNFVIELFSQLKYFITVGLPGHLRLRLLGLVLVGVVVPDVAAQRVVSLELFLTIFTDVRQVLVKLLEVIVELPAAPADFPVVVLELVSLEQLGLEEDFAANAAGEGVLLAALLQYSCSVLHDAAPGEGQPVRVDPADVLQQLLLAAVSLLKPGRHYHCLHFRIEFSDFNCACA